MDKPRIVKLILDADADKKIRHFAKIKNSCVREIIRVLIEQAPLTTRPRTYAEVLSNSKGNVIPPASNCSMPLSEELYQKLKSMSSTYNSSFSEIVKTLIKITDLDAFSFRTIRIIFSTALVGRKKKKPKLEISARLNANLQPPARKKLEQFRKSKKISMTTAIRILLAKSPLKIKTRTRSQIILDTKKAPGGYKNYNNNLRYKVVLLALNKELHEKAKKMKTVNNTSFTEIVTRLVLNTNFNIFFSKKKLNNFLQQ